MTIEPLGKMVLWALLRPLVEVEEREPFAADPLAELFVPAALGEPGKARESLGHLSAMAAQPCLLTVFARPVPLALARACQRRQLALHQQLERRAPRERDERRRPWVPLPLLWLLSPGRPAELIDAWEMKAAEGWPAGVYRAARGMKIWLIAARELPADRDSLPLRLLGDAATRERAVADLAALPDDDPMARPLVALLRRWRLLGPPSEETSPGMDGWLRELLDRHDEKLRAEARSEGEAAGLRAAVEAACELLGVALTAERAAALAAGDAAGLGALLGRLRSERAWPGG